MAIQGDQYSALVTAFQEKPPGEYGAWSAAARRASVSIPTAKKAWKTGWPDAEPPMKPIREVLSDWQVATRAAVQRSSEEKERQVERAVVEAEQARKQVIETRRQEAEMVSEERANVLSLMRATGRMLQGAHVQAGEIEKALTTGKDPATGETLNLKERIDVLWKLARVIRQAGESAQDVIRVERLLLGEPTEILGVKDLDEIGEEEAIRELEEAGAMAQRMKERRERKLQVIEGGKGAQEDTGT